MNPKRQVGTRVVERSGSRIPVSAFWASVDEIACLGDGHAEVTVRNMTRIVSRWDAADLRAFARRFWSVVWGRLYSERMWRAAGVVAGVDDDFLSEDGFLMFRCWSVMQGSAFLEAVLRHPARGLLSYVEATGLIEGLSNGERIECFGGECIMLALDELVARKCGTLDFVQHRREALWKGRHRSDRRALDALAQYVGEVSRSRS